MDFQYSGFGHKGLSGCWECGEFPCEYGMLKKPKIRLFHELIAEFGEEALIRALEKGESFGWLYHYKKELVGDYDLLTDKGELLLEPALRQLIKVFLDLQST